MGKKFLLVLSAILIVASVGGILIWTFFIADSHNGVIPVKGNEPILYTFLSLALLGMITIGISISASNEEGKKVSKKAILSGLTIAFFFFIWRLAVTL
jgi:hypothetical protein